MCDVENNSCLLALTNVVTNEKIHLKMEKLFAGLITDHVVLITSSTVPRP